MNRAFFAKEKHQNSQKWAKFMNFSFWPFLWFGLPGRLLINEFKKAKAKAKEYVGGINFTLISVSTVSFLGGDRT